MFRPQIRIPYNKLYIGTFKCNIFDKGSKYTQFYHSHGNQTVNYSIDNKKCCDTQSELFHETYKELNRLQIHSRLFTHPNNSFNFICNRYKSSNVESKEVPQTDISKGPVNKDVSQIMNDGLKSNEILSRSEKLKKAVKEYGSTVIVFHVTISLASLGIFYILVSSGLDLPSLLATVGLTDTLNNKFASNAGTFVVAYAVHKVFAPVRIAATLTATPFIVRYLRNIGWLKKIT